MAREWGLEIVSSATDYHTVETRIKEPTFSGDSLLKALICYLSNPYNRDMGRVNFIKTYKNGIFITIAFFPFIYFTFKLFLLKCDTKFQP